MRREYPELPLPAVGAVILDRERVLLVKRTQEPSLGKWSIPGGIVELGERLRDAVVREIEEEVGLKVEVGELVDVVDNIVYDEQGKVRYHYVIVDFLAKPIGGHLRMSQEVKEARWFHKHELRRLDMTKACRRLLEKIGILDKE